MPINQPKNGHGRKARKAPGRTFESWILAMWPHMVEYDYHDNTIRQDYGNGIVGVGPESIRFSFSWLESNAVITIGLENVTRFDAGEFLHKLFPIK